MAATLAGLVLAGCTHAGLPAPSPTPRAFVLPSLHTVDPSATIRPAAVTWTNAARVGDRMLDIYYVASPETCRHLANVRIVETPTTVTITVYEAAFPGAPDICTSIGFAARVRVSLRAPLDGRALLDAAPPTPEPRTLRGS